MLDPCPARSRSRSRWWLTIALLLAGLCTLAPLGAVGTPPARAAGHQTYYVSPTGDDTASGTRPDQAVRSLAKASTLPLGPGDQLLLRGGGQFRGLLSITGSGTRRAPIVVGAYGRGRPPTVTGECVRLTGSWVELRSVRVRGCLAGVQSSGSHNTIRDVLAEHNMYGVEVVGAHNQVVDSRMSRNTTMAADTPGAYDDYGASGIVVRGDHAEIAHNVIVGHVAPSADFGTDGSAIEIYGAIGTRVHHNTARDNRTFTELGNARTRDTRFVANISRSSLRESEFLVTRGPGDAFGPVLGTTAARNVVKNTGSSAFGIWCGGGCSASTLTLVDNVVFAAARIAYVDGQFGGRGNTYGGGEVGFALLPGDRVVTGLAALAGTGL